MMPFSSSNLLPFHLKTVEFDLFQNKVFQHQLLKYPVLNSFYQLLKPFHDQNPFFYPIAFFKQKDWMLQNIQDSNILYFNSSGTTGQSTSYHYVPNPEIYRTSIRTGFDLAFPNIDKIRIMALLPSYLERNNASLVWMVNDLMQYKGLPESDFYLHDFQKLAMHIEDAIKANQPIFIIGVTYALLDFFEQHPIILPPDTILMETGGMKGRKQEWVRQEVHNVLKERTQLHHVYSEYGMTELLSQAYSRKDGKFVCPPWMKVYIRDINDVFLPVPYGKSGRICVIDLANLDSCTHIATDDIGIAYPDGSFEVLGRADASAMRGCSLLYSAVQ
jgi:hypothetical protein